MRYLIAALMFVFSAAHAEPIAYVTRDGITVTLHTEKCAIEGITNLSNRATWDEGGKRVEGCVGSFGSVLGFYFADQTMAVVSVDLFRPFEPGS